MLAKEILKKVPFNDHECSLIYRRIILLFELSDPDDDAYNLYDSRIQNYCEKNGFEIIPMTTVVEVDNFCRESINFSKKYPSGLFVFSHSGRNQLRQLIRHMRNACSHAGVLFVTQEGTDYFEIKAIDAKQKKIKLFGLVPRENFEELWDTFINTLKFKS